MVTVSDIAARTGLDGRGGRAGAGGPRPRLRRLPQDHDGRGPDVLVRAEGHPAGAPAPSASGRPPTASSAQLAAELSAAAGQEEDAERKGLLSYAARLIGDTLREAAVRAAGQVLAPALGPVLAPQAPSRPASDEPLPLAEAARAASSSGSSASSSSSSSPAGPSSPSAVAGGPGSPSTTSSSRPRRPRPAPRRLRPPRPLRLRLPRPLRLPRRWCRCPTPPPRAPRPAPGTQPPRAQPRPSCPPGRARPGPARTCCGWPRAAEGPGLPRSAHCAQGVPRPARCALGLPARPLVPGACPAQPFVPGGCAPSGAPSPLCRGVAAQPFVPRGPPSPLCPAGARPAGRAPSSHLCSGRGRPAGCAWAWWDAWARPDLAPYGTGWGPDGVCRGRFVKVVDLGHGWPKSTRIMVDPRRCRHVGPARPIGHSCCRLHPPR